MSAQTMLEQLLRSGISLFEGKPAPSTGVARQPGTGVPLQWGQLAAGGAVGGALGLLIGSKRGRKMGGKALQYGGLAALGFAAYKTYQHWQAQQAQSGSHPSPAGAGVAGAAADTGSSAMWRGAGAAAGSMAPADNPWSGGMQPALPAPEVELHSRLMLKAMVAAAKADGHVDEQETRLIEAELQRQAADGDDRDWLLQELKRPLDPAEVAQAAAGPVQAAEMYLASLLVADDTSFMERAYLDELARQLGLPEALKRDLEAQAHNA